jgi:hypothetical protein
VEEKWIRIFMLLYILKSSSPHRPWLLIAKCVIFMDNPIIFTIGHSNRSWDTFLYLLLKNDISIVADIRRFPGSRLWPQFNKDHMKIGLAEHNIEYIHIVKLGGRRKEKDRPIYKRIMIITIMLGGIKVLEHMRII